VLLGPGPSEVKALIDWNRPDVASLFDESAAVPDTLRSELRDYDIALVCGRSLALRAQLAALVSRVVAVDPSPPPGRHAARWYAGPLAGWGRRRRIRCPVPPMRAGARRVVTRCGRGSGAAPGRRGGELAGGSLRGAGARALPRSGLAARVRPGG
jgi:hypothetical protein